MSLRLACLGALLLLGQAYVAVQASKTAPGAARVHGRSLTQGGSRNCSNDAGLPELVADLGTEFEAALEDALASGLLTPAAQYIAEHVAALYVLIHTTDKLQDSCNLTDATERALDGLRDAITAASESLCEEDYAAGILGRNVSNAAATLEKAGVQDQLDSKDAKATVAWAAKVLLPQFGFGVEAFTKVCTALPGVEFTYPTETCDSSGCSGGSGSSGGSSSGAAGLDPSILGVRDSGQVVSALVAPDHGALVGTP